MPSILNRRKTGSSAIIDSRKTDRFLPFGLASGTACPILPKSATGMKSLPVFSSFCRDILRLYMAKKATILIVDKEKILVDLLIRALSSPELLVIGTTSADEGARLVDLHGPDLSVIDASVQNGLPLVSSLNSGPIKTKIVAVVDSREIREQVEALHVETIVDRGSGWEALVGAIRAALPADLRILGQGERASILICDDEDDIRAVLAEYLKVRGYAVSLAKHGREA